MMKLFILCLLTFYILDSLFSICNEPKFQEKVMSGNGTWIDWQYLFDSAKLLAKCRYTLQYTYPFAYYMELSPRKQLVKLFKIFFFFENTKYLVWVSASPIRSRNRKFKLEDWTCRNNWQRRSWKSDGCRREKKVSSSIFW